MCAYFLMLGSCQNKCNTNRAYWIFSLAFNKVKQLIQCFAMNSGQIKLCSVFSSNETLHNVGLKKLFCPKQEEQLSHELHYQWVKPRQTLIHPFTSFRHSSNYSTVSASWHSSLFFPLWQLPLCWFFPPSFNMVGIILRTKQTDCQSVRKEKNNYWGKKSSNHVQPHLALETHGNGQLSTFSRMATFQEKQNLDFLCLDHRGKKCFSTHYR